MARLARSNPNLTREAVIEAAAAVLERDGHGGLTMRAVAAELKVQAPALYWHVANKQALEVALYDHLMTGLEFAPVGDDWREDVRRMAWALRRHLLSRRDIGRLVPNGFFVAPNTMTMMEVALGVLLDAGLKPRDAFYAFATCFGYVVNWSIREGDIRARPQDVQFGLDAEGRALLKTGAYPRLITTTKAFADPGSIDEQFAFGLNCLISGFERLVAEA